MARKNSRGYLKRSFRYGEHRYYVYGRTSKELNDNEIKKRRELEKGAERMYNPTLTQYYEHFTDIRRREVKESTLRAQQSQFKNVSGVVMENGRPFGEMRLKAIRRKDVERAREILLDSGKTPQNLNICFAHLNHVFANAVLDDTLEKNPCKGLKPLMRSGSPIGDNRHRALTVDETRQFFSAAEERNSYYLNAFLLMAKTGMRLGEVTALYPTDIDHRSGFIHVRRTIVRNEANGYEVGKNAKTTSGARDIPLTDEVYGIIRQQEELNRAMFGLDRSGLIFRSVEGGIMREYSLNREIKRICTAAEIDVFTCHAFRNTFATRFIEQRPQDYKILSELLGHKDVSITLNLYTHVMTENKVKAMNEISVKTS